MRSMIALAGLMLLAGGCWWIWPPLALIVLGAALLAGAVWGHVRTPTIRRLTDAEAEAESRSAE